MRDIREYPEYSIYNVLMSLNILSAMLILVGALMLSFKVVVSGLVTMVVTYITYKLWTNHNTKKAIRRLRQ